MSHAALEKLLPIMAAQKDQALQRMAQILQLERECTDMLVDLLAEDQRQAQAFSGTTDGLTQWRIWLNGQRTRVNLRLASLRAERETQAKKLAQLAGRLDVTETMVKEMKRKAAFNAMMRAEEELE